MALFGGDGVDIPEYSPYSGGFGGGTIDISGDRVTATLDPKYQAFVEQFLGGARGVSPTLSPEQMALGRQATGQAGAFFGGLQADPFALAEAQFGRMEAAMEPGRQRARTGTMEQLLAQGRLGSTGGARTQAALEGAFQEAGAQNYAQALQQALGAQAQQAQIGQQLGAFGLGAEQAQFQRMLQGLGQATALESLPLSALAPFLGQLSGQRSQHQLGAAELAMAQQGGGFGDILSGALSAGLSAYTGGLGKKLV